MGGGPLLKGAWCLLFILLKSFEGRIGYVRVPRLTLGDSEAEVEDLSGYPLGLKMWLILIFGLA